MKFLFPVLIAAMLIACGKGNDMPQETDESVVTESASDATSSAPVTKKRRLREPLPESISLTFPYHARRTRIIQRSSGAYQYRVLLEFLQGDLQNAAERITDDLVAAGFRASKPQKLDNGGLKLRFEKEGYGRVNAIVRPAEGQTLRHVKGKGTIRLEFPADAPDASDSQ